MNLCDEDIKLSRSIFSLEAIFRMFKKGPSKGWALQFRNITFRRKKRSCVISPLTWTINSGSLGSGKKKTVRIFSLPIEGRAHRFALQNVREIHVI